MHLARFLQPSPAAEGLATQAPQMIPAQPPVKKHNRIAVCRAGEQAGYEWLEAQLAWLELTGCWPEAPEPSMVAAAMLAVPESTGNMLGHKLE